MLKLFYMIFILLFSFTDDNGIFRLKFQKIIFFISSCGINSIFFPVLSCYKHYQHNKFG